MLSPCHAPVTIRLHVGQYLLHQELVRGVGDAGAMGAVGAVCGMGATGSVGGVGAAGDAGAMGATGAPALREVLPDIWPTIPFSLLCTIFCDWEYDDSTASRIH